ncbi:MAG: site-2 protease family protein [Bdellovibrionales bacterium]|nr:site-2 protease family protein [Bdellovibrionales bacterium]
MSSFSDSIQRLSIMIVPFLMAVIFHEFAHGFVASRWGDQTARDQGRLTLNPAPHIDPLGTLLLPMLMLFMGSGMLFGWARPVPINPTRFRKYRAGLFWVSLAGPAMNFILAAFSGIAFAAILKFMQPDFYLFDPLLQMTKASVLLNFSLGLFNLLPLPPLDGSKILEAFLPYNAMKIYESITPYSLYIFLALMFTGALSMILSPSVQFLSQFTLSQSIALFRIPLGLP